jgi:hypothetical protein
MFECKEHGRVRGRKHLKYCPVCGKEVIPIPLFPLAKVYVWKGDLFKGALVLALAAVAVTAIVASSHRKPYTAGGGREGMTAQERDQVERMAPEWKFAYLTAKRMSTHDRRGYLSRYVQQNQEKLTDTGLTQPQVDLFLDLVGQYEMADVATTLARFHKPAPATQPSGA